MKKADWEKWEVPGDDELIELTRILIPYIRLLSPEIVSLVVEDNNKKREKWSKSFTQCGVNPDIYLWSNNPVCFPGIRRHSGSKEISAFKIAPGQTSGVNSILIDDNSYPKEIWSFILRGDKFSKSGPDGFSLAHILDHKDYHSRNPQELKGIMPTGEQHLFSGFFTSAVNTMWVPKDLLKPTDHNIKLRMLLIQLIDKFFSRSCKILPFNLEFNFDEIKGPWNIKYFSETPQFIGEIKYIQDFLNYREEIIEKALEKKRLIC